MPPGRADDGGRVDYTEHHRSGAGRPVVLLAGFGAPATSWCHQVPALVRAGHRVVTADLPGPGTAGPTPDGSTMCAAAPTTCTRCWSTWTCAGPCWSAAR